MNYIEEIIALEPGSKELDSLKELIRSGDKEAAKKFVYFCALQKINADRFIPKEKKHQVFKELVEADILDVQVKT